MIPQRVQLKGFLCYEDEQEVRFDGNATLWMLSGLNGSGKSSIFDAVTYALFGHHRGGGQQAVELINKDSDSLLVEFDFLLDGKPYRAKRTARRDNKGGARGTQQILRRDGDNGDGKWVPVEGTGQKREFDAWVAEHVGLTYETFTSSVLLLQGKAEKLLDSKPEGRREVLAGIVDLERYERLHKNADDRRRTLESDLKIRRNRLEALPKVEPLEMAAADERIRTAEEAREKARADVDRLIGLAERAREWADLQKRCADSRNRWEQAERLLGDATAIEQDVDRLRELRDVLPRLHVIAEQRNEVHKADEKTKQLTKERQKQAEELTKRDHALKQSRDKRVSTQNLIDADAARQRNVSADLRQRSIQLEKLKEYERHEGDLDRLREEKLRLPEDPATAVARARESVEGLTVVAQTAPPLSRLALRRDELRQAVERGRAARQAREAIEARRYSGQGGAGNDSIAVAGGGGGAASGRRPGRGGAHRLAAGPRPSEGTDAAGRLEGLPSLRPGVDGRPSPRGEAPPHRRRGRRRRRVEAGRRVAASRAEREQLVRDEFDQVEHDRNDLRVEYAAQKKEEEQAQADAVRLREECGQVYGELPETYRVRVAPTLPADWLATTYPAASDLASLRAEAAGLSAARQLLLQAEQVREHWHKLTTQEASKLQEIARLQKELPADPQEVRREHARLETDEKCLEKSLRAKRQEMKEIEKELERLAKEHEQVQSLASKCDAELKNQELVRQHAQQTWTRTRNALPSSWHAEAEKVGTSEIFVLAGERDRLEKARTDDRGRELQQARLNLDVLRQDKDALEARVRCVSRRRAAGPGGAGGAAENGPFEGPRLRRGTGAAPGRSGRCWIRIANSARRSRKSASRRRANWRCRRRWRSCWAATACSCTWCGRRSGRWWSTPTRCSTGCPGASST